MSSADRFANNVARQELQRASNMDPGNVLRFDIVIFCSWARHTNQLNQPICFICIFLHFVRWRVRENKLGNIPTTWLSVAMYGIAKMMLLCIRRYIQDTYVFYRGHIRTSIETLRKK